MNADTLFCVPPVTSGKDLARRNATVKESLPEVYILIFIVFYSALIALLPEMEALGVQVRVGEN